MFQSVFTALFVANCKFLYNALTNFDLSIRLNSCYIVVGLILLFLADLSRLCNFMLILMDLCSHNTLITTWVETPTTLVKP